MFNEYYFFASWFLVVWAWNDTINHNILFKTIKTKTWVSRPVLTATYKPVYTCLVLFGTTKYLLKILKWMELQRENIIPSCIWKSFNLFHPLDMKTKLGKKTIIINWNKLIKSKALWNGFGGKHTCGWFHLVLHSAKKIRGTEKSLRRNCEGLVEQSICYRCYW